MLFFNTSLTILYSHYTEISSKIWWRQRNQCITKLSDDLHCNKVYWFWKHARNHTQWMIYPATPAESSLTVEGLPTHWQYRIYFFLQYHFLFNVSWHESPKGWDHTSKDTVKFLKKGQPNVELVLSGNQKRLIRTNLFSIVRLSAIYTLKMYSLWPSAGDNVWKLGFFVHVNAEESFTVENLPPYWQYRIQFVTISFFA